MPDGGRRRGVDAGWTRRRRGEAASDSVADRAVTALRDSPRPSYDDAGRTDFRGVLRMHSSSRCEPRSAAVDLRAATPRAARLGGRGSELAGVHRAGRLAPPGGRFIVLSDASSWASLRQLRAADRVVLVVRRRIVGCSSRGSRSVGRRHDPRPAGVAPAQDRRTVAGPGAPDGVAGACALARPLRTWRCSAL